MPRIKRPAKIPVAFRQTKRNKLIFEARAHQDGRESYQDHFDHLCKKDAKKLPKEIKDQIDKRIEQEEQEKANKKSKKKSK